MKKILVSLIAIFTFFGASAQNEKDPKAKTILEELSKKNKSYTSIQADFKYTLENKDEGINETQTGKLMVKGNKYRLEIVGQEIISNGTTIWTYIKDANEVQINNVPKPGEDDNSLMNPAEIFTIYEKGFKYKFDKEETKNGKVVQHINLFPEKANEKAYHTIKMTLDKATMQIMSIKVLSKDGNIYTYELTKFVPNGAVTDAQFNFDVSKVGEVIDLRD